MTAPQDSTPAAERQAPPFFSLFGVLCRIPSPLRAKHAYTASADGDYKKRQTVPFNANAGVGDTFNRSLRISNRLTNKSK